MGTYTGLPDKLLFFFQELVGGMDTYFFYLKSFFFLSVA